MGLMRYVPEVLLSKPWLTAMAIVTFCLWCYFRQKKGPILGIYRRAEKWYPLKFLIAYAFLAGRKKLQRKLGGKLDRIKAGYGVKSRGSVEEMEKPQKLSNDPKAVDAVYISGFDRDGNYVVLATARHPNNVINGFAFLRIPEVGLLKLHTLPDSTIHATRDMTFGAEGILIEPVQPMRKWKAAFDGLMKFEKEDNKTVKVKMDLAYESSKPCFDFDTDIPPRTMARALAREIWSREFVENLRRAHQTHYEQMGSLRGKVTIEGHGTYDLNLDGYRDHSYGRRDWSAMHRYGLHSVSLEDGTMFTVGIVSQPINLSVLEMGYLYTPHSQLFGVDWCLLPLHCHGENGTPPTDYSFTFGAGGKTYHVQVDVIDQSQLNMGLDWEARFVERFCRFTVNGIPGWGISEWEYRRHGGRPKQDRDDLPISKQKS